MAVFTSRRLVKPALPVVVTITGKGNSSKCYAIINGTKQYSAGTYEVNRGETIRFYLEYNKNPTPESTLTIDGEKLADISSGFAYYDWIVPDGTSTVEINFYINMFGATTGKTIVTTA